MAQNTFDYEPTLVQVMAWCHQAPSHYLKQCWPRSMCLCSITRAFCKFNSHLASIVAQQPAKFQSNTSFLTPNPIVLKLHVLLDIETGTTSYSTQTIPCHHRQQFVIIDTDSLVNNSPPWRSIGLRIGLIDLMKIFVLFSIPYFGFKKINSSLYKKKQ